MDIGTLIAALTAADKESRASNPFAPLQSASEGIGAALLQAAPNFSPKENLIGGLISGLMAGATGSLADSYQEKQNTAAENLLEKAILGQSVFERPEGMPASVFSKLKTTGNLVALENALTNKATQAKANSDLNQMILGKYLDNPQRVRSALGGAPAPAAAPGTPAGEYQLGLDMFQGDESMARTYAERGLTEPDRAKTQENLLRDKFRLEPAVQDLGVLSKSLAAMQSAIKNPTAAGDLDIAYALLNSLDPKSIVRETELGLVAESQSIDQALLGRINKFMNAEPGLREQARKDLLNVVKSRYDIQKGMADAVRDQYSQLATRYGVRPENVVSVMPQAAVELAEPTTAEGASTVPGVAAAPQAYKTFSPAPGVKIVTDQQGNRGEYRLIDGQWRKTS